MPFRRYLPLTPREVEEILRDFDFVLKRTTGDHRHWEGMIDETRRVVTVQAIRGEFTVERMKTIIQNMGLTPERFYGQSKRIAKRYIGH